MVSLLAAAVRLVHALRRLGPVHCRPSAILFAVCMGLAIEVLRASLCKRTAVPSIGATKNYYLSSSPAAYNLF